MGRLSIDLSPEQHKQIKAMAALKGMSIKELVLGRLFGKDKDSDEDWAEFVSFLKGRIDSATNNPPSSKTLDDIARDVLRRKGGS